MDINVDTGRALLVIVLTLIGVIVINVFIYYSVRGKNTIQQIELMKKAVGQARRNPWETEDKALQELSVAVKELLDKNKTEEPVKEHQPGDQEQ
jgi:hypothetical protein